MTNTNFNTIPEELRELNQWVCWKINNRDGKQTKVPCDPISGKFLDPSKKVYSFNQVCQCVQGFNGIGFYFNGSGISGIDLDHCIDDSGNISHDARQIIEKLNSYTEYSPSGKGFHILLKGKLQTGSRNKQGKYEAYSDRRYFTVTGNIFENRNTVSLRQEELEWFVETYIQPNNSSQSDEIIKLIQRSKNADKFNRLMNGDISEYCNDDSKADAGLLSILAFFTKKNRILMEEIFNMSKLAQREKWTKRKDYRNRTITNAIESTKEVYGGKYLSDSFSKYPSQNEQIATANSVLEQFENPSGPFDTSKLPGKLGQYVDHICTTTDADPIIVTASVIGMFSGFLKKSVYIPEDDFIKAPNQCYFERLHPNVYFLSVLQSGRFKTTALNKGFRIAYQMEEQARISEPDIFQNHSEENQQDLDSDNNYQSIFLPQKSTVEALLRDINELGGGVIVLSELGSWLQEMEKSYNLGLKSMFTNLYDVPAHYCISTKKEGRIKLERPCISIVGTSTIDWVKDNNNIKDVSTGFFARFLIFNPPEKVNNPPAMPARRPGMNTEMEEEIKLLLTKIPTTPREYSLSLNAFNRFNEIHSSLYTRLNKLPDHTLKILEPYVKRWSPYILKIGMIFQFIIDPDSTEIDIEAIESAYEIVKYAIKSTTYLFKHELAESKHQANCRKILKYIAKRTADGKTTTRANVLRSNILTNGHKDYDMVLEHLIQSGSIKENPAQNKMDKIYVLISQTGEVE